jgi:hypothetical protein
MSISEAVTSSYVDFRDLGWKNFIRRAQGLETKVWWCKHQFRRYLAGQEFKKTVGNPDGTCCFFVVYSTILARQ